MDQETLDALLAGEDQATLDALSTAPTATHVAPQEQPPQTNFMEQVGSGVSEGIATGLGGPVAFSNWSTDLITRGINKLTGANLKTSAEMRAETGSIALGGPAQNLEAMAPFISDVEPQTKAQRYGRRAGQELGAGAVMAPLAVASVPARVGAAVATDVAADIGSGLAAQAAREYMPESLVAELLASAVGGVAAAGATVGALNAPSSIRYRKEVIAAAKKTPTVAKLKNRASVLYSEAEKSGVTATVGQVGDLNNSIVAIALDGGLVSPTGRVNKAYPKVNGALDTLKDYAGMGMTPVQMRQVRKTISGVAGSADPAEARIGVMMLKAFDEFSSPLTPSIAQANRLYTNAMRGDKIDMAIELAADSAGTYTGAGFENALRIEFRRLSKRITKGQERGLSPDQIDAIKRVARGGNAENFFRALGKAAPTGPVSVAAAGGMPYLIGTSIGGPVAGSIAAGTTMGGGAVSRHVATKLQTKNAEITGALMRGMALPARRQDPVAMNQALVTWAAQNAPASIEALTDEELDAAIGAQ